MKAGRPETMTPAQFRALRLRLNLSQTELGLRLGLGYKAINRRENCRVSIRRPEAENLRRLAVFDDAKAGEREK